jgi:hypothetical protein
MSGKRKGRRALVMALAVWGMAAGASAQQGAVQEGGAQYQAPRVALDKGATTCVGLLQDAMKLTVEAEHQELSSWHPREVDKRTLWAASVDRGGERGSFVGVTPAEDRRCDAQTVRASWLKQECKAVVGALPKGSETVTMGAATVIRRDQAGRLSMYLPAGPGCMHLEMAVLYGR